MMQCDLFNCKWIILCIIFIFRSLVEGWLIKWSLKQKSLLQQSWYFHLQIENLIHCTGEWRGRCSDAPNQSFHTLREVSGPLRKNLHGKPLQKIMKLMWLGRKMSLADRQKKRKWCELRKKNQCIENALSMYSKKTMQYHYPTFLELSHISRADCNGIKMFPEIPYNL